MKREEQKGTNIMPLIETLIEINCAGFINTWIQEFKTNEEADKTNKLAFHKKLGVGKFQDVEKIKAHLQLKLQGCIERWEQIYSKELKQLRANVANPGEPIGPNNIEIIQTKLTTGYQ